jgi:hypothetical protein
MSPVWPALNVWAGVNRAHRQPANNGLLSARTRTFSASSARWRSVPSLDSVNSARAISARSAKSRRWDKVQSRFSFNTDVGTAALSLTLKKNISPA